MKVPVAAAVVTRFGLALLLGSLVASAGASAETEHIIIKNHKQPDRLLNMQDGAPLAAPAALQAPGAQWRLEPTGEASFVRLLNVGSGLYLQNDRGRPVAALIEPGAQKADWTLEIVPGHPDTRIHSRAGGYLHTHYGPLAIGEASPERDASYWKIMPVGGHAGVVSLGPAGPRPDTGPSGSAAGPADVGTAEPGGGPADIGTAGPPGGPADVGTGGPPGGPTDGGTTGPADPTLPTPVVGAVPGSNRPPIHVPTTCPASQHFTNGHCCPNLEFWNDASHKCTLLPIRTPRVCLAGQHLSNGHCCGNLQSWNTASHKCTLIPIKVTKLCPAGQHLSGGHCCPTGQDWLPQFNDCSQQRRPVNPGILTPQVIPGIKLYRP
jgi:hypothetical protein